MKTPTTLPTVAVLLALTTGVATSAILLTPTPASAAAAAEKKTSLKVGPSIKEGQTLITQKKYKEAVAKLQEADNMQGKTAYDNYAIKQLMAAAYSGMQDYTNAAKATEALLAAGQESEAQNTKLLRDIATFYYQAKNYPKFNEFAARYLKDSGGSDPDVQMLMAQVALEEKNYKVAVDTANVVIKNAETKGQPVKEDWLRFVRAVDHESGNTAAEQVVLETLAQRYQKAEYWNALLINAQKTIKGGLKVQLDIDRIMFATGVMTTSKDYTDMAELALAVNLAPEAKRVIETGVKNKILAQTPADKGHTDRLLNMANTQATKDVDALPAKDTEAKAAATGEGDVKVGELYWATGQYDKAIDAIQRGLKKGLKEKDDAQLRLGVAYLSAGKKQQAADTFKAITPNTPQAQVARLWTLLGTAKT